MTKMKLLFHIQELGSISYFPEEHGDQTYSNIFSVYMVLLDNRYLSMVVFGVILRDNLANNLE